MSYKDTLNLPRTAFPMKANLPKREPERLLKWKGMDLYAEIRKIRKGCPFFILHDGPPYANGRIHVGHAVNKILKDFINKSQLLFGKDVPFVPGWDCHGLPIELHVERELKKRGKEVDAATFRRLCREYAASQVEGQKEDFERLGVLADWAHPYLTMDPRFEADILRALGRIIEKGYVYRGVKPVHWCPQCGSALAEAEVEYQERTSPAIDVKFRVLDEAEFLSRCHAAGKGPISVVIWTTTPWTLPANRAVALHPELDYVLVETQGERLLLAKALMEKAMGRWGREGRIVGHCKGKDLEGILLMHPFYDLKVPIVLSHHVTLEAGTGAVHIAPGHGMEDFTVGQRYGLEVANPVDDKGRFYPSTPLFGGEGVWEANPHVIQVLKARGALLHAESLRHSYPHCWRHKTPILFRATPQWFISMEKHRLREEALEAIEKVRWIPEWGEGRIKAMVESRPDWCISRQRAWGVPIALFVHKETGEVHPKSPHIVEEVARRVEEEDIEAWFSLPKETFLGEEAGDYEKVKDVLDVWFDSGVTHFCVLERREELAFPADMYLEGSDQHRGWFQSSLLTAMAIHHAPPYRQVLTHGFTVDEQGRKMSKSRGNVVAPQQVVNTLGADILRLWVAATDYRAEMGVSEEILKRIADAYRRIRNTARFLLANLHDFDPALHIVPAEKMVALDRWAVDRALSLQEALKKNYEDYTFHTIVQRVHNFCAVDMGSLYLDIIKDRQYTMPKESLGRRSAQTAIFHIIETLTRGIAPILSFTADEIWEYMPGERLSSVFFETWYEKLFALSKEERDRFERLFSVREVVSKVLEELRNQDAIGASLDAEVDIYCISPLFEELSAFGEELRFVFITSEARVHPLEKAPPEARDTDIPGLSIHAFPSPYPKCARCWHHRPEVGENPAYPDLCGRCVLNITGPGEIRRYA